MPVKLIKYLPHLVAALLLAAALGLTYRAGFQTAYHKQQVIIEQAEKDKSAALLASSWAFAAELERANARQQEQAEKTQQTGMKLAAANAEIGRLKQQYRKGIHQTAVPPHTRRGIRLSGRTRCRIPIAAKPSAVVLQRMVRLCNRLHQPAPVHPANPVCCGIN
jgi:hypothetical protein